MLVRSTPSRPNRVAEVRRNLGISQTRLAALLGTKQPEISKLETGMRYIGPATRCKVALALGVPEHELFPVEAARTHTRLRRVS